MGTDLLCGGVRGFTAGQCERALLWIMGQGLLSLKVILGVLGWILCKAYVGLHISRK